MSPSPPSSAPLELVAGDDAGGNLAAAVVGDLVVGTPSMSMAFDWPLR